MFYHSGYPKSWHTPIRVYAIYEHIHDCFLYVHYDLNLVKKVKSLLSSKAMTWIYELRLPSDQALAQTITNHNAVDYTLQADAVRPDPVYYLTNGSRLAGTINCTELNTLGEISGLEYSLKSHDPALKALQEWAQFVAWVVNEIQSDELFDDELITRSLIADINNNKSPVLDNDMYMIANKIYRELLVEQDIQQTCNRIGEIALQARNAKSIDVNMRPYKNIVKLRHYSVSAS